MEYRFLGKSGLKVSALSFGSWVTFGTQTNVDSSFELMKLAYDAGVNFFDNAEVYASGESEIIMGKVLKKAGWKRSDLVISTKIFWGGKGPNDTGLSRKHIIEGTNEALKRLQLEYVDLIFCHRPDIHTPMEETVWAMNHILQQGKALYWGTSEWSATQLLDAWHIARTNNLIPPLMDQPEYNMFRRDKIEAEFLPLYEQMGLGTTIWSPLASGILTNKYAEGIPKGSRLDLKEYEWLKRRFETPEGRQKIEKTTKLKRISDELKISLAEMSIAWCLKNHHVSTVILGASKTAQLKENLMALDAVPLLSEEVMNQIETVLNNKPVQPQDWRG
jgi:voltage-dependent potassium channel beta subunit